MPTAREQRPAPEAGGAADAGDAGRTKIELISGIARLQGSVARRRAELAADEHLLASLFSELEDAERSVGGQQGEPAVPGPAFLTLGEACVVARCNEATLRKKLRRHQFGRLVDRRWKISRARLLAHLAGQNGDVES